MSERPITQITLKSDFIDLGMGNPDLDLLPMELLGEAAEKYFAAGDRRTLQYGLEQGNSYFRDALADFLTEGYGEQVNPGLLFVTAGASSALDLLCTLYTQPGDVIFVEEPSYFLALRIFEDHGLQVIPLAMDNDGLQLDALEDLLAKHQPKFIYTIPTFQNPSGRTLAQAQREKLIDLAQTHNFLIVADEVYHFLPYTQEPPRPFAAFTQDVEQVISVNSFSKILAPGLRLGWIQAHGDVMERLVGCGLLDSGGGMNPFTSAVVQRLIESGGLKKNITHLREEYTCRLNAMDTALQKHLPDVEYTLPTGGFFFWLRLPGVDAGELRQKAQEFNVGLRQGALFSSQNGNTDYIRLGFCFYPPEGIEEGIKRLSDCLGGV